MKVVIREAAEHDLDGIFAWIAKDNRHAAADMVARIRDRINLLGTGPTCAHAGSREPETLVRAAHARPWEVNSG